MTKALAVQPTMNPTRKLAAATISAAVMAVAGLVVKNLAPQWFDAGVWLAMTPVVAYVIGWFVKDEATTVILTQEPPESENA